MAIAVAAATSVSVTRSREIVTAQRFFPASVGHPVDHHLGDEAAATPRSRTGRVARRRATRARQRSSAGSTPHRDVAEGIKLYAISYDDSEALLDYVEASGVEFTLLSDIESAVIKNYEVFNTIVQPEDLPFYGVPFPGFFLLNEDGVIVDKLFNRHFAHRDGVEAILDSYAGRVAPGANEPIAAASEDDGISVTAFLRGGGVLRVGLRRRLTLCLRQQVGDIRLEPQQFSAQTRCISQLAIGPGAARFLTRSVSGW